MNNPKYLSLSPAQEIIFIGKLVVAAQKDEKLYDILQDVIKLAEAKGVYDKIIVQPENETIHSALSDIDSVIENGPGSN